ncbi:hypothetical protein KIN20_026278 [Parelaphostrongylus tenuis]|uniref:Uncharacterized protein n=1 Tax=Parelaphostrongylus tenuis TaxID=148309 RepID=A0AAD5NBE1_PARTN|nr:hypothetical protein KIN20_026278 [Parelaphostrongylus tenuis]
MATLRECKYIAHDNNNTDHVLKASMHQPMEANVRRKGCDDSDAAEARETFGNQPCFDRLLMFGSRFQFSPSHFFRSLQKIGWEALKITH